MWEHASPFQAVRGKDFSVTLPQEPHFDLRLVTLQKNAKDKYLKRPYKLTCVMMIPLSAATCFIRGSLTQPLVTKLWPPTASLPLSCCRVTKHVRKTTNSRMSEASTSGHKFTVGCLQRERVHSG